MSAVDTLRDALFGNPPVEGWKPSREGTLAAFTEMFDQISALQVEQLTYATVPDLPTSPTPDNGTQARVLNDPTPANNTIWVYKSGAWVIDIDYINSLAYAVAPFVTLCRKWASELLHVEVDAVEYPGLFSAFSYAQDSSASATTAATSAADAVNTYNQCLVVQANINAIIASLAFYTTAFYGPGVAAGGSAVNDTNTWFAAAPFEADGYLDTTDISINTIGASTIQGYLVSREIAGTFKLEATGPTQVFNGATGPAVFNWGVGGIAVKKGWYRAFRRTAAGSAKFATTSLSASGGAYTITGAPAGTGNTATASTFIMHALDHVRYSIDANDTRDDVDKLINSVGGAWDTVKTYIQGDDAPTRASGSAYSNKVNGVAAIPAFKKTGWVSAFTFPVAVAGLFECYIVDAVSANDGNPPNLTVVKRFWINCAATGDSIRLVAGTDYTKFRIKKDQMFYVRPMGGSTKNITRGAFQIVGGTQVNASIASTVSTIAIPVEFEIEVGNNIYDDLITSRGRLARKFTSVYRNGFTSLTGLTVPGGGFTLAGGVGGLSSPAAAGYVASQTLLNQLFIAAHELHRVEFKMANACSWALVFSGSKGGAAVVDFNGGFASGLIGQYSFTGTTAVLLETKAVPFTAVAAQTYFLEVERHNFEYTVRLKDTITPANVVELTRFRVASGQFHMFGSVGFVLVSGTGVAGDVIIQSYEGAVGLSERGILVLTDSNGAFGAAVPSATDVFGKSWVDMIDDERNRGDLLNCAFPGADSSQALNQAQMMIPILRPAKVIVAHGTNEAVTANWQSNVTAIKALCDTYGCEMILATVPPRPLSPSLQVIATAINNLTLGRYLGCRYIDLAAFISVNQDRLTWITGVTDDSVHYNRVGVPLVYKGARTQAPFLLDGAVPTTI